MKDIGRRSVTAFFWGSGGAIARIFLQLVTQIVLARILGPTQYGLFAIGAIVISFSNFFSDIGIAYGLIQKVDVTDEDVRFVFTWQIIVGSLVTLAVAYFSLPIATFLGDVEAKSVVFSLAVVCILNALAAPSNNLLKRNLDFKSMQIAQLLGYVGGYILVGVPLALLGLKVWALVSAWIIQSIITLLLLYFAVRHPLKPLLWSRDARKLSQYGGVVLITNITNWFIGNIDRVIIARFFTPKEIGLYATGYSILQTPTSSLLGVIQPVFFSASSRLNGDKLKVIDAYYALVSAIAIFILPVFLTISTVSETFIISVYGQQWAETATIFRPLALAMPLFLIWGMTTPLLWTGGAPIREFKAQLPIALLWTGVSWVAAHYSMAMVGWAVCGMFGLRCFIVVMSASRILDLTWSRLWLVVRGGVLISLICAISAGVINWVLLDIGITNALVRLVIIGVMVVILYILLLFNMPNLVLEELAKVISRLANHCPPIVSCLLNKLTMKKKPHVIF